MVLVVVLAIVGGASFFAARTIEHAIGHRQFVANAPGASLRSKWTPTSILLTALLTMAIFVPLLFVTYEVLALVEHALGQ
jgi:hypothetical protein